MGKKYLFTDNEVEVTVALLVFGITWQYLVSPFLQGWAAIAGLPTLLLFFLKQAGLLLIFPVVVGTVLDWWFNRRWFNIGGMIRKGMEGWLAYTFFAGLIIQQNAMDMQGNFLVPEVTFSNVSAEIVLYELFAPHFKDIIIPIINLSFLYPFVYLVIPIGVATIFALIYGTERFKEITRTKGATEV